MKKWLAIFTCIALLAGASVALSTDYQWGRDVLHLGFLLGEDGTASRPTISWEEDTNSGIYRIGSDNMGMTLGGTKKLDFGTTAFTLSSGVNFEGGGRRVELHAATDTLTIAESGSIHASYGLPTGTITFTLPEASTAIGVSFTFAVIHGGDVMLIINPSDATDHILGITDAPGDCIQSNATGDLITLRGVAADAWFVESTNNSNANADSWADAN